jgi:predicted nuclease of predicted toxin-antitoxin system
LGGFPDAVVFVYARTHQLILLTIDQDFLNTQQYPPLHSGIVVVRVDNARVCGQDVIAGILLLADQTTQLANAVQVIDPGGTIRQVAP